MSVTAYSREKEMIVPENKKMTIEFLKRCSSDELRQHMEERIKPHLYKFTCSCKIASMRVERLSKALKALGWKN